MIKDVKNSYGKDPEF